MPPASSLSPIEISGLLVGGLALFLFGLELITEALKAIAGSRLQSLLGALTMNRLRGVLAGAGITALLNSSTITTVLLVGFVSAGLMTLQQAIPLIMGANIGSTLTAQIIAFDISAIAPFLLAGGFLMHGFATHRTLRKLGGVLMGLGLLFLGLEFMGNATRPLRQYEPFIAAMQDMRNPWIGIAAGAIFTAIVQSSAATLAIVITLGSQGLMPLESGIALILGANVGTCGTALLASIGKSSEAVQVGIVHLIFNLLGVLCLVFFIPQFADLIRHISPSSPELHGTARLAAEMPRQAANAHTVFSVLNTAILIWFTGPIGKLAQWLAPNTSKDRKLPGEARYLDRTLVDTPALAIARAQLELSALSEQVLELTRRSTALAAESGVGASATLADDDKAADARGMDILTYVGSLSEAVHTEDEGRQLVSLARISTYLDSIREIASVNMFALSQRRAANGANASQLRGIGTSEFASAVLMNFALAIQNIAHPDADSILEVVNAKAGIEAQAEAARQHTMSILQLRNQADVAGYRLAGDMIERLNEIARLSRAIAKACRPLNDVQTPDSLED
ncbi:Na/Pi cotransporter family protein [Diaphorobacter ruginosibacter]|uniref:Na/Pi cotransporter family protein n=1 Tax=Diaphorobacter ruginosibacter TaxID=1715720 RepID=UPI00333E907A